MFCTIQKYYKIYEKFIYIYIFNDIFIIKMEHMQLMTTLIITYAIIFDKTNQIKKMKIYL